MRTTLLILFALLISMSESRGQNSSVSSPLSTDTVRLRKVFGGFQFYHRVPKKLTTSQLEYILYGNEHAMQVYQTSNAPRIIADILSAIGGSFIGVTLGTIIVGEDPTWAVGGIGAGLITGSIPLYILSNKRVTQAVRLHNIDVRSANVSKLRSELRLAANVNGIGLTLNF